jgi:hypothetical protein
MSVNIADIADLITQEERQAEKYEDLIKKAVNEDFKKQLEELRSLSVKKLNILVKVIKEGPWGNWE